MNSAVSKHSTQSRTFETEVDRHSENSSTVIDSDKRSINLYMYEHVTMTVLVTCSLLCVIYVCGYGNSLLTLAEKIKMTSYIDLFANWVNKVCMPVNSKGLFLGGNDLLSPKSLARNNNDDYRNKTIVM